MEEALPYLNIYPTEEIPEMMKSRLFRNSWLFSTAKKWNLLYVWKNSAKHINSVAHAIKISCFFI